MRFKIFRIFFLKKKRSGDEFSRGTFFKNYRRRFFLFGTVTTTQQPTHRRQHWGNQQHILTRPDITKHNQTQTHHTYPAQIQAHFTPSGTRLAQLCQDSCFVHDANMFARQGMSQSTRTPTLLQVRGVCTQREPTGGVIIVIVAERKEREEKSGKRDEKENDRREKERTEERKREEKREEKRMRKTPPCVDSKRLRVCVQDASVCTRKTPACSTHAGVFRYTRRRLERTHGRVLNLHTERFSACQAAPHTPPTAHTTPQQNVHTTTPKHKTHIPHTPSTYTTAHTNTSTNTHTLHTHHTHECLDTCTAGNRS